MTSRNQDEIYTQKKLKTYTNLLMRLLSYVFRASGPVNQPLLGCEYDKVTVHQYSYSAQQRYLNSIKRFELTCRVR